MVGDTQVGTGFRIIHRVVTIGTVGYQQYILP